MRTNGILDPGIFGTEIQFHRHVPAPDLAHFVERFWTVRWNLTEAQDSAVLPYPCVNMVVGSHRPGVHGTTRRRFVAKLVGNGWVLGTKFRPAGFRTLSDRPMSALVDRDVPIETMFGAAGSQLVRDVHALTEPRAQIGRVEEFLRERASARDADSDQVNAIVELAESDRELLRVAQLAARAGLTVRTLERLFRRHVGVSPKWVLRRFRVQEAAARVAAGEVAAWSALAYDLGFFDQAHFIREFKLQIGSTPERYAAAVSQWNAERQAGQPEGDGVR
jgi:AraC-like DNA-binding protein